MKASSAHPCSPPSLLPRVKEARITSGWSAWLWRFMVRTPQSSNGEVKKDVERGRMTASLNHRHRRFTTHQCLVVWLARYRNTLAWNGCGMEDVFSPPPPTCRTG